MNWKISILLLSIAGVLVLSRSNADGPSIKINVGDTSVYITHIQNGWADDQNGPLGPAIRSVIQRASGAKTFGILYELPKDGWQDADFPEYYANAKIVGSQGEHTEQSLTLNHIFMGGNFSACMGRTIRSTVDLNLKQIHRLSMFVITDGAYDFGYSHKGISFEEQDKRTRIDLMLALLNDQALLNYVHDGFLKRIYFETEGQIPFKLNVFRGEKFLDSFGAGPDRVDLHFISARDLEFQ